MGFPEVGKGDTDVSESRSSSRNSLRKGKERQSRAVSPVQVCVIMTCPSQVLRLTCSWKSKWVGEPD